MSVSGSEPVQAWFQQPRQACAITAQPHHKFCLNTLAIGCSRQLNLNKRLLLCERRLHSNLSLIGLCMTTFSLCIMWVRCLRRIEVMLRSLYGIAMRFVLT